MRPNLQRENGGGGRGREKSWVGKSVPTPTGLQFPPIPPPPHPLLIQHRMQRRFRGLSSPLLPSQTTPLSPLLSPPPLKKSPGVAGGGRFGGSGLTFNAHLVSTRESTEAKAIFPFLTPASPLAPPGSADFVILSVLEQSLPYNNLVQTTNWRQK